MPLDGCDACGDGLIGAFAFGELLTTKQGAAALGVAFVFAAAAATHYAYDEIQYGDQLDQARTYMAENSVNACGDDEQGSDRNGRIYESVQRDLERFKTTFSWMPNKNAAAKLELAKSFDNLALYPSTLSQKLYSFDNGVQAILYNEGEEQPIFAYGNLGRSQFNDIMDTIEQNGLPEGNAIVRWNNIEKTYEIRDIPAGETSVVIDHRNIEIKTNPCHIGEGITGVGKQLIKDKTSEAVDSIKDTLKDLIPGGN